MCFQPPEYGAEEPIRVTTGIRCCVLHCQGLYLQSISSVEVPTCALFTALESSIHRTTVIMIRFNPTCNIYFTQTSKAATTTALVVK